MWTLSSQPSLSLIRTKPSTSEQPLARRLLTSVPLKTMPASIVSRIKYSWNALRLDAIALVPARASWGAAVISDKPPMAFRVDGSVFPADGGDQRQHAAAASFQPAFE